MKRSQLEKHLKKHGCKPDKERAKHSWWEAPGGEPRTSIPRHNEIGYGLARDICKQLGVPPPTGSR